MRLLRRIFWRVQKPTPLMGIVREDSRRDEVVDKMIALIVGGLWGAVMFGLILMG